MNYSINQRRQVSIMRLFALAIVMFVVSWCPSAFAATSEDQEAPDLAALFELALDPNEIHEYKKVNATSAIGRIEGKPALDALREIAVQSPLRRIRRIATDAMVKRADEDRAGVKQTLMQMLAKEQSRNDALRGLFRVLDPKDTDELAAIFKAAKSWPAATDYESEENVAGAVGVLSRHKYAPAYDWVRSFAFTDPSHGKYAVRQMTAIRALATIGSEDDAAKLWLIVTNASANERMRIHAVHTYAALADPKELTRFQEYHEQFFEQAEEIRKTDPDHYPYLLFREMASARANLALRQPGDKAKPITLKSIESTSQGAAFDVPEAQGSKGVWIEIIKDQQIVASGLHTGKGKVQLTLPAGEYTIYARHILPYYTTVSEVGPLHAMRNLFAPEGLLGLAPRGKGTDFESKAKDVESPAVISAASAQSLGKHAATLGTPPPRNGEVVVLQGVLVPWGGGKDDPTRDQKPVLPTTSAERRPLKLRDPSAGWIYITFLESCPKIKSEWFGDDQQVIVLGQLNQTKTGNTYVLTAMTISPKE